MPSHYNNPEMEVVNPGEVLKFSSQNLVCARCGKKLEKKHYLIQVIEYCGEWCPRVDICDDCFNSYTKWILGDNIDFSDATKNITAMSVDSFREIADDFMKETNEMLKGAHL